MFLIKGSHQCSGGSTKSVLSDRLIVYTKSRKQLLHRKYLHMTQDIYKETKNIYNTWFMSKYFFVYV